MKKLNNKGFTLIEMVIVIVIIAILAAMLVPSLLSYVDNANQKSFMEACGTIKTSVLSYVTEQYSKNVTITTDENVTSASGWTSISNLVGKTVGAGSTLGSNDYVVDFTLTGNTVTSMVVTNSKYTGTWTSSSNAWTIAEVTK